MSAKHLKILLAGVLSLSLSVAAFSGQKSPNPATSKQDSFMFGRILGAIEDLGGGYNKEALHKFASINKDLEKLRYSPRTNWMGHRYYGDALFRAGKREDAIHVLEIAKKEAAALTEKEQKETDELLKQARAQNAD
jgi:hypothetical protein